MMLRASSEDASGDFGVVMPGSDAAPLGLDGEAELFALAEAAVGGDPTHCREALREVAATLGEAAAVDAAAVAAQFNAITRIADATGIQLDRGLEEVSADLRESLGIGRFNTTV